MSMVPHEGRPRPCGPKSISSCPAMLPTEGKLQGELDIAKGSAASDNFKPMIEAQAWEALSKVLFPPTLVFLGIDRGHGVLGTGEGCPGGDETRRCNGNKKEETWASSTSAVTVTL
ncbi:hypothetical protein PG996_007411 [Apiospora saccharicola]|uniref:Uncharacterized protein n=1 Tax=Apiospora saccharicola TaxID=335842 RepID=A0ABR1VE68_9PEZI